MSWVPQSIAPAGCREPRCVHLIEHRTAVGPHDQCAKRLPMHMPCAWYAAAKEPQKDDL